jgi:hypothetical protein
MRFSPGDEQLTILRMETHPPILFLELNLDTPRSDAYLSSIGLSVHERLRVSSLLDVFENVLDWVKME